MIVGSKLSLSDTVVYNMYSIYNDLWTNSLVLPNTYKLNVPKPQFITQGLNLNLSIVLFIYLCYYFFHSFSSVFCLLYCVFKKLYKNIKWIHKRKWSLPTVSRLLYTFQYCKLALFLVSRILVNIMQFRDVYVRIVLIFDKQ